LIDGPTTNLVARILEARDRTLAPPTAGPEGLYLVQVTYPDLGFEVPCRMPMIW
jgi:tRNA U38,U39,U40 pseudouridine synthase TruA